MRAARLWPLALVAVLALTVTANVWLLWAANDEQSRALEPDYYRKALAWDSTMAEASRSVALGWRLSASIESAGAPGGRLLVTLSDSSGRPIEGAALTATTTPIAHADRAGRVALRETAGGYQAEFPLVYQGLYEIRIEAVRGSDRFVTSVRGTPGAGPLQP
jgi:nitrogen fixation protein FixH